jgi:hypothetical protein
MAQALELRDEADIVFPAFSKQPFDVLSFARIFPPQFRMGLIFVSVIYLRYDDISAEFCQLAYNFCELGCFVLGCHEDMQAPPVR